VAYQGAIRKFVLVLLIDFSTWKVLIDSFETVYPWC